jgi:transposase
VYNRFNRWSRRGFWLKLLDALADAGAVTKSTTIDSTYVKALLKQAGRMRYLLADKAMMPTNCGARSATLAPFRHPRPAQPQARHLLR